MAKTPSTPTGRKGCGGHTPSSTIPRPHGKGLPALPSPMQNSCFMDITLSHAIHLRWLINKTRAPRIKRLQNATKPRRAGSIIPTLEDKEPEAQEDGAAGLRAPVWASVNSHGSDRVPPAWESGTLADAISKNFSPTRPHLTPRTLSSTDH